MGFFFAFCSLFSLHLSISTSLFRRLHNALCVDASQRLVCRPAVVRFVILLTWNSAFQLFLPRLSSVPLSVYLTLMLRCPSLSWITGCVGVATTYSRLQNNIGFDHLVNHTTANNGPAGRCCDFLVPQVYAAFLLSLIHISEPTRPY